MVALLERAKREGAPLIDGDEVTFVWSGRTAPCLVGDINQWDMNRAVRLEQAAPQVWFHRERVPRQALIEYAYLWEPSRKGRNARRIADPFNARTKENGFGERNHYFYMPEAKPTPLVRRRRGIARGVLERHTVEVGDLAAGRRRDIILYRPPVANTSVPLLVVLDGQDYRQQGKITAIVDNLIAQKQIQPIAMALVNNSRLARWVEYGGSDITLKFLIEKVISLAKEKLEISKDPCAVLGASMGGVMALYSGLRAPQVIGKVLSQSGAFSLNGQDAVVFDLVRHGPVADIQIWLNNGTYDKFYATNERLTALLKDRGYEVTYRRYEGGHNYYVWRDELVSGLEVMFGRADRRSD
jgi:enterochelin esterase-like enzyme